MFNVKEFFAQGYNIAFVEKHIGNETFKLRPMDGRERLTFNELKTQYERISFALAKCLIDGVTLKPVGEYTADILIERYGALSEQLLLAIIEISNDVYKSEIKHWEDAEKNLPQTDGKPDTVPTADATD